MGKRIVLAGLMVGIAGAALGADMPPAQNSPPLRPLPPPAVYSWSGLYLGVNGGYGFGSLDITASAPPLSATVSEDLRGPLAGGQIGFNWQTGVFVFGAEVDAQWSDINNTTTFLGVTAKDTVSWFGTARLRAGIAAGNVLFYGTGGGAYGQFKSELTALGLTLSSSENRTGWTAGGGVEAGFGNWSIRGEYLFVQSGTKSINFGAATVSDKVQFSVARGALNYRFGATDTVTARY